MDDQKATPLSNASLGAYDDEVKVPTYDRSKLSPGIVHIGLGNFHRAHQSWYLHRLLEEGLAHDWAIIGAGVRPNDEVQRRKLLAQDFLTTLISLDPDETAVEIVGSMIGYVPVEEQNGPLIAQLARPEIRIISLTVTEGGYYQDPATGGFDDTHPDIRHDAHAPDQPRTAFGAIIAALRKRRDEGHGPVTLLSCDNLQGNGSILRQTVLSLARMSDPDLAGWIDAECSFPNSMVDCIVPATGKKEIEAARSFGIDDQVPVTHEGFRQWVIEDDFCRGRPEWDRIGATFSDRVQDYEAMKLRLLNGGHQIVCRAGELLSIVTVSDCMAHPLIATFFRKVLVEEILPHVRAVPDIEPLDYVHLIGERFANTKIVDTVRRIVVDGTTRHPGFLHPTLRDALKQGGRIDGLALTDALWARAIAGTREDGSEIEPSEPNWREMHIVAMEARTTPSVWLKQSQIYGDLAEAPEFAERFEYWLSRVWSEGTEGALRAYVAD